MKLRFSTNALRRLSQIKDYFASINNPGKGHTTTQAILDRAKELENFPKLGPPEENLKHLNKEHRSLLAERFYKIVYVITKPFITVTDIFDTRRNPDDMKP